MVLLRPSLLDSLPGQSVAPPHSCQILLCLLSAAPAAANLAPQGLGGSCCPVLCCAVLQPSQSSLWPPQSGGQPPLSLCWSKLRSHSMWRNASRPSCLLQTQHSQQVRRTGKLDKTPA